MKEIVKDDKEKLKDTGLIVNNQEDEKKEDDSYQLKIIPDLEKPKDESLNIVHEAPTTMQSLAEKLNQNRTVVQEYKEEELTWKGELRILFILVVAYVLGAAIPTAVCMLFLHMSFWMSQIPAFLINIVLFFALGFTRPASPEQLLKRDMRYKKIKKKKLN